MRGGDVLKGKAAINARGKLSSRQKRVDVDDGLSLGRVAHGIYKNRLYLDVAERQRIEGQGRRQVTGRRIGPDRAIEL